MIWPAVVKGFFFTRKRIHQAIMRLRHQNKHIREITKTLGVAKSTVWYISKKKERIGELSNTKRPGRLIKEEIFLKKSPLQQLARSRTLSRR